MSEGWTHGSVRERIRAAGVVAVLRAPSARSAIEATAALVEGGISAIEITYSTPEVPTVLAALRDRFGEDIVLGAGTITTADAVTESTEAGASFLVSPVVDEPVLERMTAVEALAIAGALTPTEIVRADRLGADIVKIFPGTIGGPGYLRSLRGPFPGIELMPTGGVVAENLADWFAAGALAVGSGTDLCAAEALATGDYPAITTRAREYRSALDAARRDSTP